MNILHELHQDHINLNRLLQVLQQELDALKRGRTPDFNLLADVISYIADYADGHHHPREDEMYAYFAGRNEALDRALEGCAEEHYELSENTGKLQVMIDDILHDAVVPMPELISQLEAFLASQTAHLDQEEGELFPLLRETGDYEDWEVLNRDLPRVDDPLFNRRQADEYSALYQALLEDIQEAG